MVGNQPITRDVDRIHELLAEPRRRDLVYFLLEHERTTLDEFTTLLAAWEEHSTVDAVAEAVTERVAISLVHNHLPRLVDHDIIGYDHQRGEITLAADRDELRPLIEHSVEVDVGMHPGDEWSRVPPGN